MVRVACPACIMRDPDEVAACWRCGGDGYVVEDPDSVNERERDRAEEAAYEAHREARFEEQSSC